MRCAWPGLARLGWRTEPTLVGRNGARDGMKVKAGLQDGQADDWSEQCAASIFRGCAFRYSTKRLADRVRATEQAFASQ
jgi:hypothetical protein